VTAALPQAFILGPVATAMMIPLPPRHLLTRQRLQQAAIDKAGEILLAYTVRGRIDYYPGSWATIASLTLNGALPRLGPILQRLSTNHEGKDHVMSQSRCPAPAQPPSPPPEPKLVFTVFPHRRKKHPPPPAPPSPMLLVVSIPLAVSRDVLSLVGGVAGAIFVCILLLGLCLRRMCCLVNARAARVPTADMGDTQMVISTSKKHPTKRALDDKVLVMQSSALVGQSVRIIKLSGAQHLNGCLGTAVSFSSVSGRYHVAVTNSPARVEGRHAIRPHNLELAYDRQT
jgi:hypothetical protein